jgi:phage gp46-like protein
VTTISVNLRQAEGSQPQPVTLWDTIWDEASATADWGYAQPAETQNIGGLQAIRALETVVELCLFTDLYCPPTHPLAYLIEDGDAKGWWGDAIDVRADLGEEPMGSLLWLLRRAAITSTTALYVQSFALDALSVIVRQGLAAKVDAQATLDGVSRIDLAVQVYGRNGQTIYSRQFVDIWNQASVYGFGVKQSPPVPVLG